MKFFSLFWFCLNCVVMSGREGELSRPLNIHLPARQILNPKGTFQRNFSVVGQSTEVFTAYNSIFHSTMQWALPTLSIRYFFNFKGKTFHKTEDE